MNDPYSILGVAFGASPDECKAAYRRLAKKYHPDVNHGDPLAEEQFKKISAAYDAIINPKPDPEPQVNPFRDFGFNFHSGSPFDDIFAHLRGQQRNDVTYEIRLTLEEAFQGKDVNVQPPTRPGTAPRELTVKIPRGIEDGTRLMMAGAGNQSNPNVRPGDLYILIRVTPHNRFTRHGLNLITMVPVTAFDVLLRDPIEVVGIDGKVISVAIPDSFDSMQKLRLAGQGMIDPRGLRGDLLIELFIQYPTVSAEHREALRNIAKTSS
jgi:curved DNA-binding protein